MNYLNEEEEDQWPEPKQVITDKQFVIAVIIAALLFILIEILYFYHEQNKNKHQTKGQPTYKCAHHQR